MFKVGDIVLLKSGGPRMTVSQLAGDYVACEWFTSEWKAPQLIERAFKPETLMHEKLFPGQEGYEEWVISQTLKQIT